ncbi:MAG: hypothetical protein ABI602_04835 [Candidatus Saccharibacteria bacterium]
MIEKNEQPSPKYNGDFPTREAQLANTAFRGMEPDATLDEVLAHDQMEADVVNAEHFDYPLGTPSREIGHELNGGDVPKSE